MFAVIFVSNKTACVFYFLFEFEPQKVTFEHNNVENLAYEFTNTFKTFIVNTVCVIYYSNGIGAACSSAGHKLPGSSARQFGRYFSK
jgi:hypothetical protein